MKPFQFDGTFHPSATGKGLRRTAVRGAGVSIAGSAGGFALQIGSIVVLARLLTPADFGIVTMVTTFSLLLRSFGLAGFTEFLMQREELTDSLASNLFWINAGIGTVLTLAFASSGPLLALFYHNPAVVPVTRGVSLTIGIGCSGYVHTGSVAARHAFQGCSNHQSGWNAALCHCLYRVGDGRLALLGAGLGQCRTNGGRSRGRLVCLPMDTDRPGRAAGTGSGLKFAMNVYSHFAFSYLTRNTDNLLVGWRFGAGALGFYKRAYDLFVLPETQLLAPLSAVVVSTLSRVNQDREQFQRYFLRTISVLALVGMGIGADFALVGKDIIRFLFGPAGRRPVESLPYLVRESELCCCITRRLDSSFDRQAREMAPLGFDGVWVYRESIPAGSTMGAVRSCFRLDRLLFPAHVSRLLVRGQANWTRYSPDAGRHLEVFRGVCCSRLCNDSAPQSYALFCDGVWVPWRSRKDGFRFFGILRSVSQRNNRTSQRV